MGKVLNLNTEVVHQYVFELRYGFGHLYWDRCGKVINEIISDNQEWDFDSIRNGVCHLTDREKNLHFNYSAGKLDLTQTQSIKVGTLLPIGEFASCADSFSSVVVNALELTDFTRIGFRAWYLYPAGDREESQELVRRSKLARLHPGLQEALGNVTETSYRLVVERPDHMVRIAVAPFEQAMDLPPGVIQTARERAKDHSRDQKRVLLDKIKAERVIKSYPQFGVLVDLDAYIEDPPYPDDLSVSDFIATAAEDFGTVKALVLEAG